MKIKIMKRKKTLRLGNYNYTSNGYYFITVCTYYRRPYIVGKNRDVVAQFIEHISTKIKGVSVDYYVLMPTHIHLILILEQCEFKLGEVVRRLKAATSKQSGIKLWQPNYYEHVIRNERALGKIREYIINNPLAERIEFTQFYK
ncbi:transposase [candidate division WOR-3 bacterium]|nr:transposase [candidate division WOR-3 bacterium]